MQYHYEVASRFSHGNFKLSVDSYSLTMGIEWADTVSLCCDGKSLDQKCLKPCLLNKRTSHPSADNMAQFKGYVGIV